LVQPTNPLPSVSLPAPRPTHALHSFPTRRSSDLLRALRRSLWRNRLLPRGCAHKKQERYCSQHQDTLVMRLHQSFLSNENRLTLDRKSTRLNSSHLGISYAVFCLKKKKQYVRTTQ